MPMRSLSDGVGISSLGEEVLRCLMEQSDKQTAN